MDERYDGTAPAFEIDLQPRLPRLRRGADPGLYPVAASPSRLIAGGPWPRGRLASSTLLRRAAGLAGWIEVEARKAGGALMKRVPSLRRPRAASRADEGEDAWVATLEAEAKSEADRPEADTPGG